MLKKERIGAVIIAILMATGLVACGEHSASLFDEVDSAMSSEKTGSDTVAVNHKDTQAENVSAEDMKDYLLKMEGNTDRLFAFIPADYDGDGSVEAFGFFGDYDDWGYYNNVSAFLINSDKSIEQIMNGDPSNEGYISPRNDDYKGSLTENVDTDQVLIPAGKHKYLVFENDYGSAYGDYSIILGVKDDKIYYPSISGTVGWFRGGDNNEYSGSTVKNYNGAVEEYYYYKYDEESREFIEIRREGGLDEAEAALQQEIQQQSAMPESNEDPASYEQIITPDYGHNISNGKYVNGSGIWANMAIITITNNRDGTLRLDLSFSDDNEIEGPVYASTTLYGKDNGMADGGMIDGVPVAIEVFYAEPCEYSETRGYFFDLHVNDPTGKLKALNRSLYDGVEYYYVG